MRAMAVEHIFARSRFIENAEHGLNSQVLDARRQLAVREGAGAALSEEDIGIGIEAAFLLKGFDILNAVFHRGAALEDDRAVPGACQGQRRKDSAGTEAGDDGTAAEVFRPRFRQAVRDLLLPCDLETRHLPLALSKRLLEREVDRIHEMDVLLIPRIDRLTDEAKV